MNPAKVERSKVKPLTDLPNIGPAMAKDLELIGINTPPQLVGKDPVIDSWPARRHSLGGITPRSGNAVSMSRLAPVCMRCACGAANHSLLARRP